MVTFPHIPWSILRDPVAGMFDLGTDEYNGALIDRSKYEKFELLMMDLRRLIETLIIEHYVQAKRIDDVRMKFKDLQNETNRI
ncbi:unnamed protein product [Rotaria socialis]|uniref:Uncharacterized protein n=1 Tax=Rotaria socialis TaxID=392032 RepID=A0A817SVF6_9BILA|nr:unnamed protein product [Rotaria socialis]